MFDERPQASQQLFTWRQVLFQPHPGTRPTIQIAAIDGNIRGRRRRGGTPEAGGLRLRYRRRHGTRHDSKPLPSPAGIRLSARPLRPRQQDDRSARASAPGYCGGLLGLPPAGAGYDHLPERRFEFIPFWGFLVFFLYRMRRVHCRNCGIVVEQVPWSDGKHQSTQAHMLFLARWARKLSWKETAESFHTSWDKVCDAVEYVVRWGLEHRTLESIRAIGVDEIQYAKGHKYLTLVYQIDAGITRLLWVGKERTIQSFQDLPSSTTHSLRRSSLSVPICGSPIWM